MLKRVFNVSMLGLVCSALVVAGCDKKPPCNDGGTVDLAVVDMTTPPPDLSPCNPADPNCTPPDMAKPPADMTTPPGDMTMPPADMTMPPRDMSGPGDMTMPPGDMTMPPGDMTMPPGDMTMPPRDMSGPGDMTTPGDMGRTDGGTGMAGIGDPCTADTDCKVGPMPSCWKSNVLNNTANPATTGGYCSSSCGADSDCGSGNRCVNIGAGKYCLKGCSDAMTCRHPGYACAFVAGGVCYPDSIYDCDPKSGTGTCTEAGTGKMGGCMRQAYEDKGSCSASCDIGAGKCADKGGNKRQCIYYDASRDGFSDVYKGLVCVNSVASPKATGAACTYLNECVDGDECDPVDGKCHVMCGKGGMPACATGMCQDDLTSAASGPGLCR